MPTIRVIAIHILILLMPGNMSEQGLSTTVANTITVADKQYVLNASLSSWYSNSTAWPRMSENFSMSSPCESQVSSLNLIYSIFLIAVTIVAFLGNTFVCFVICRSVKLRSQSVNHLLLSLAISDILVSMLSLPIKIHMGLHNQQFCMSPGVCWFFFYSDIFANCSSVTHLLVINIQRFVAITFPFDSQFILSRQRIDILIGLVWLYSAIWSFLCTFSWSNPSLSGVRVQQTGAFRTCINNDPIYWTCVYVAVFLIPLVIMGCLQVSILRSVKSHSRNMLKVERNADKALRMRKREVRVATTVSIVYAAFTACWLPVCLLTVSSTWCQECFQRFRNWNQEVFVATFLIFVQMLPPLSSTLNPFIYVISGDEFKKAFKTVLFQRNKDISRLPMTQTSDHRSSWV